MKEQILTSKTIERLKTFGLIIGLGVVLCTIIALISAVLSYLSGSTFENTFFLVAMVFVLGFFAFASMS